MPASSASGGDPSMSPTEDQATTTMGEVGNGGSGPPPGAGPPGSGPPDDKPEWYRNTKILAAIGAGAVVVIILAFWALSAGDGGDDDEAASTTSTVSSTTSTTSTTAAPSTTGAPAPAAATTTSVEITDGTTAATGPAAPSSGSAQSELDAARNRWASVSGQPYVFSYTIDAEGLTERHCVSGTAGDPASETDTAGACGSGVLPGGAGVEGWFDTVQDAIVRGELGGVSYDPANGHPTSLTVQSSQGDGFVMTQEFLQFQ